MSIYVKKELDFNDIVEETWECDYTLDAISEHDLEEEFISHLEEVFFMNDSEIPTMTELNDYIRFESETILIILLMFAIKFMGISNGKMFSLNLIDPNCK